MWPWIKRWRDWAMYDLWPLNRIASQPQALHFSYEKAGLTVYDQPIPWNAEAVLVEAQVRLQPNGGRRKSDFQLRIGDGDVDLHPAEQLRRREGEDRFTVAFRLPPPGTTTTAAVLYRDKVLGQLNLPYLSRQQFIDDLRLQMPTLYVRLGEESIACQTFVATQCKGLLASAVLVSPTSLTPLLDLDLQLELRCERSGATTRAPIVLCSSQLTGRQALVTVVPRGHSRRIGALSATWLLGDRPLASQRVRGISQRAFQRSLRISDTRFVVQGRGAGVRLLRTAPTLEGPDRVGPCFLVSSTEAGMAGRCRLRVTAQVPGAVQPPLLLEQDVLISDGPTMVAPGTLDPGDLKQVTGFELSAKSHTLGLLSLCPAPAAAFTSEGGFKPAHDFTWSAAAEEEMTERLNRLLEGRGKPD
jgi:hypothetical protein